MNIRIIIILFSLLFYSMCSCAQNTYDTQKFINSMDVGRYNVLANHNNDSFYCIKNTCTIKFNKTFNTVPVVFLMNTVNFNDEQDQPSALIIKKVTTSSVSFQQVMAPDNKRPSSVIPKPMKLINYLVVEEGTYQLPNNSYVIASRISTNYFQYKFRVPKGTSNYNKWVNINLNRYIKDSSVKLRYTPGVLHQKQTDNNKMWLTTTVNNVKKNKFQLSLEKSEIDGYKDEEHIKIPIMDEKIGFLAGYGDFSYQKLRILFGIQQTKNTLLTPDPITSGCGNYVDFKPPFESIPYIFANKDARKGPDGGWVRLCQALNNKASFAIDEDMDTDSNRDHQGEVIGYVAIDYKKEEPPINELCKYFPSTVSSNDDDGEIWLSENSTIYGEYPYFTLNFDDINHQGSGRQDNCRYGNTEWKCEITSPYEPTDELDINIPNIQSNQEYYGSYNHLYPGTYGNVFVYSGTIYLSSGDYYFNSLNMDSGVKVEIQPNSSVRIFSNRIETNNVSINANGESSDLLIYSRGDIDFYGHKELNINAFIYSLDDVYIHGRTILTGAVTAEDIKLYSSAIINSKNTCINPPIPPVEKNKLIITPQVSYGLTCERIPIDFYVYHDSGKVNTDFVGNLTIKQQDGICWSTTNDGYCFTDTAAIPISGGHIQLYMQSVHNGNVNINANLAEDKTVTATGGPYRFAPYGFRINGLKDIELVAGKPKTVTIEAVASRGAQCTVIKDYQGSPQLTFSNMQGLMPKRLYQPLIINADTLITDKELSQKLLFQEGISHLTLKYSDAGSLDFSVFDPKWRPQECSQRNSSCSDWEQNWSGLQGKSIIKSRPWTFAICPLTFNGKNKYDNASGTSNGGEAYTAAGKPFDIVAKPLIWQIGDPDSESAMVDVSEQTYCNRPVTQNFFAKDAPSLNTGVTLSNGGLDSPNNGQKGVFSSQPQTDNSQQEFNGLLIADNSWSEVGSLWVNANLTNYLGMTVNSSKRHIGRFFPAYFGLTHNQLTPAMTSFTYMGQPFPVHWTVNAFNQQGKALDNYDQFAETLTAKFGFVVKNNNGGDDQRLLLQDPIPEKWSHNTENSHSYINYQSNVTYARKGFLSTPLITLPDGPDELWQLWLNLLNPSENRPIDSPRLLTSELCSSKNGCTNPTVQKVMSLRIGNTNPMRYGRMALQDAAGDIGKPLTIPLRVEYWNGAEFVTNSDDSASTFDGANYCRQILIQEPMPHTPNNPTTSGAGTVNLGQPLHRQLMANPDGDFKQQIRFWQRLSTLTKPTQIAETPKIKCENSTLNQPWLSYNWRGLGDEDPSATVTFGVYHGNNRIIYRGEANAKDLSIPYQNYQ
ncbi:DUF6701 domain-containing protein [Photobacterium piscicola]|uniref:DUF6701 domain-containing protein n=1 Tax=Photobacterium piscicola TaxID=1378299 RepID=A0ABU6LJ83_9GAMM|nr:DUF6701 domain-containing protein [Photobacterium piscicola]